MPAEHGQVGLGAGELVRRHREHVVGDLVPVLLIEVVADAGPVRQQMLARSVLASAHDLS